MNAFLVGAHLDSIYCVTHKFCAGFLVVSLLRKGMQKIIISLEGAEARDVEERAEKGTLSREDVNKVL